MKGGTVEKRLRTFAVTGFLVACATVGRACAREWGWGVGLFPATLADENYSATLATDDLFEGGTGIDLHAEYAHSPFVSLKFGVNSIGFRGEAGGDPATTQVKTDAIRAGAFYGGVTFHSENVKGFGFYGTFELGVSHLDDVKHSVIQSNAARGVERALDGGSGGYLGAGFGASYGWSERWNARLGLMVRSYGTLQGNAEVGRVVVTEDVDVTVGGLDLAVTYWF